MLGIDWNQEESLFRKKVHMNSIETRELILQYYARLADLTLNAQLNLQTGVPRCFVRLGYYPSTNQQILLYIYVIGAQDIPILDTLTKSSDPYLRLELYPRTFFPFSMFPPQSTDTQKQTLTPRWNKSFQLAIPEEYFFTHGACLCLTVLDEDVMSYNDLAGQALLPLATIPKLTSLSFKHLPPPVTVPLVLPINVQYSEHFKILEQRSGHDPIAKDVVSYEKYVRDYRILPPNAQDDKETSLRHRLTMATNKKRLKSAFSSFITQK